MITASCHCGAVQLTMDRRPTCLTQCTCSICRRYAALWCYRTRKTARVTQGADRTRPYVWGDGEVEFHHCTTCGCLTHYVAIDPADTARLAVNARLLPPEALEGVRIRTFDGADTWAYLD